MKHFSLIPGLLVTTAASLAAQDGSAPLENSKAELRALSKDQATNRLDSAQAPLLGGLPSLTERLPSALPNEGALPAKSPSTQKKQQEAARNWLLEGVGRLEKESSRNTKDTREQDGVEVDEELDPADPNFILKSYAEQIKKAKTEKAETEEKQQSGAATQVDPLAPFLQGWLAGSPVRGRFFDELLKRDTGMTDDEVRGSLSRPSAELASGGGIGAIELAPMANFGRARSRPVLATRIFKLLKP